MSERLSPSKERPGATSSSPLPYPRFGKKGDGKGKDKDAGQQGVKITREEVESAFAFFDVQGKGVLRPKDLKARLGAFYPQMTNKEYRFLISEQNFTVDTLWNLLDSNTIMNFDPVKEAFKVYDPQESGYVDPEVLKSVMSRMGYGDMTREDLDVLIKTADMDGDGKISLEDFRSMLNFNKNAQQQGEAPSPR
ncbi:Calmodulin-2 [Diplonema papillatum]|nr:Calmodulin-2 [Diplonema papillatum]